MLEVRNVTKIYSSGKSSLKALDNVSINFGSSGLVVVLGKSGCGKSTLLNIIGGLDTPTAGEVVINGQSTRNFSRGDFDAYRNTFVGIVFQEFNLIDDISVYDNINMTMKLQEKNADVNTVDEALALVGLSNLGYRKPSELSGGQRQRVALARALLKKPEIILADEPTGALDSVTSEEVFENLKRISQSKLVIVVTHNRDLAFAYGDRIIEIVDGKIVGDKMRSVHAEDGVKELPQGVIEVGAGGKITAAQLNERLKSGETNYIGLVHEKDRVALAYPETVETFYAAQSVAAFSETDPQAIKTDDKPFRLSKGGFKMRDAWTVARSGMKRMKKRSRFLIFIMSMCFTFFALALVMGSVNMAALAANSAYTSGAQPLVAVGKASWAGASHGKMASDDIETINEIMDSDGAPAVELTLQMETAEGASTDYYYNYDTRYYNTAITGAIEVEKLSDIGLKLIAGGGKESCEGLNEVMISDFVAHVLCRQGFIGFDSEGKYGAYYPLEEKDLVGCKISFQGINGFYTVVGVFDTNYEDYASIVTASQLNTDAEDLRSEFAANKFFLYSKLIGGKGFALAINEMANAVSDSYYDVGFETAEYIMYTSVRAGQLAYVKGNYESNYGAEDGNKNEYLLWSTKKGDDGNYVIPDSLAENEMVVTTSVMRSLMGSYGLSQDELVSDKSFLSTVNKTHNITVSYRYANEWKFPDMKIVAVFGDYYGTYGEVALSEGNANKVLSGMKESYDLLYFNRGISRSALSGRFSAIEKYNNEIEACFLFGTATADMDILSAFGDILNTLGIVFVVMAIVAFLLGFLITFNYMTASIRLRTKEIAVYRVIGAKTFDVAKTFLVEGGIIVIWTTVIATILSFLFCLFINNLITGILGLLGITFSLVNFNWFIEPIVILLGCALTIFLSSIIPIMRVCGKKPVEAVKLI